jgi:NADH:ubiquinone oxidoreductase subunit H
LTGGVIPFGEKAVLANIDAGVLYLLTVSSLGVLWYNYFWMVE